MPKRDFIYHAYMEAFHVMQTFNDAGMTHIPLTEMAVYYDRIHTPFDFQFLVQAIRMMERTYNSQKAAKTTPPKTTTPDDHIDP